MSFVTAPFGWLVVGIGWLMLVLGLYRREQRQQATPVAAGDLLAGGVLLLLTFGFFWRTLSGDVYQPADGGDLVSFLYPTYRFAAAQVHQWTLPLWNPHLYGGAPFIGDIQAGFLYPPNLLLFLLWPEFPYNVMQWLSIGHLYWAGLGLYLLLRTWHWRPGQTLSRPAALFGAIAFQFSDPLLIHLGNLNLIAVLSWLPWCLAAYHQALTRRSYRWTALAALLFTLSTYAGHAQSSFYVAIAVALYTVGDWLFNTQAEVSAATNTQGVGVVRSYPIPNLQVPLLFYTLAALFTAPIVLPALELTRFTERGSFTYQDTVAFSLAPTQLIGLLTPGFFGHGPALHWSLWARVETPYAGVATLLLALGAFFLAEHNVRRRLLPWLGLALLGLTTALGIYALVHGWLTALLPFFGQFRAPARALVLWTFAVAIMGAVGVEVSATSRRTQDGEGAAWQTFQRLLKGGAQVLLGVVMPLAYFALLLTQENETTFLRASVAALALTFVTLFWLSTWAILGLYRTGWLSTRGQALALAGLLFFDLAANGAYTDISPSDPTQGFVQPEIVAFLRNTPAPFRIDTLTAISDQWQPDTAALYGLQDVGGIANPLLLAQWRILWTALSDRQTALYDMLNVHYVIVKDETPLPPEKFELALDAPGALAVYRNRTAMPRAWLVHDVTTVTSSTAAMTALTQPAFDPRQQAIVNTIVNTDGALPPLGPATGTETVQITAYGSNEMKLTVEASAPALLVLSELWYPGWQATIDGVPKTILQVNGGLRGIVIPAGSTTVALTFAPTSWRMGLGAFAVGCCLLLAGWLRYLARRLYAQHKSAAKH